RAAAPPTGSHWAATEPKWDSAGTLTRDLTALRCSSRQIREGENARFAKQHGCRPARALRLLRLSLPRGQCHPALSKPWESHAWLVVVRHSPPRSDGRRNVRQLKRKKPRSQRYC